MAQIADYFGNYPCKPGEKKPMVITREKMKLFIYTPDNPYASDINWLFASTDQLTVGVFQLAPGGSFDPPDIHAGDEVYYILNGTLTELNPENGQVEEVKKGEAILLPKGAAHKAYNFGTEKLTILYVIAPKIWEKVGVPMTYHEKATLYKYDRKEEGR